MRREWSGQRVLILGAARQGLALAQYLVRHGASVTLNDRQPAEKFGEAIATMKEARWVLGSHPTELLDQADLVCVSGGVPLTNPIVAGALARGIPLSNDSQIFLEAAPCKVIGITGSAGKTTTTTLVGRMAKAALTSSVFVGGNIGSPLIALVDEMTPDDLAIIELSSFQLEIMDRSPQIVAVLNVTPNHLDRHGTMQAYLDAKRRILTFQDSDDVAVLGRDDPGSWGLASQVRGELVTFGIDKPRGGAGAYMKEGALYYWDGVQDTWLLDRASIALRGEHNLQNVLAACAIIAAADLPFEAMQSGVADFTGVAHRLEFVRTWKGAHWYNDSIATAPERAIAAIRSFDEPLVLLAGGRDKDLPWGEFATLVRNRVDHLIVFGEAADKIIAAMGANYPCVRCTNLRQAVEAAAQVVEPGDVVLLAPGGTSFDEFKDFEERGECFRKLVMSL
jgi:UDP-N-acetylmuramoylalanine--D-glutamate ligase